MTIAEELSVRLVQGPGRIRPARPHYKEGGVYSKAGGGLAYFAGRSTVRSAYETRVAGGRQRPRKTQAAAAAEWKVAVADVNAANSILTNKNNNRTHDLRPDRRIRPATVNSPPSPR